MTSSTPPMQRPREKRRARAALLALAAVTGLTGLWGVAGCGAAQREPEPLDQAVRVYNDGLRWQRFDEAASRLPAARRDDFLDQRDQLHDDLRISEYDVIRVRYDDKQRRARVQVKYTWYLESRGVVHETHAVQTWHRGDEIWVMRGERFLRGEVMPGLQGADEDPEAKTGAESKHGPDPEATPGAEIDAPPPAEPGPGPDDPGEDPLAPEEDAAEPPQGS
jgi:hypothetical protein